MKNIQTKLPKKFLNKIIHWAKLQPDIFGIALAGSYARQQAKPTSDIDLIILTDNSKKYLADTTWTKQFGKYTKIQIENYGKAISMRTFYKNNLEVEFTFVTSDWAAQPLDVGTQRIIKDGIKIIYDPKKILNNL